MYFNYYSWLIIDRLIDRCSRFPPFLPIIRQQRSQQSGKLAQNSPFWIAPVLNKKLKWTKPLQDNIINIFARWYLKIIQPHSDEFFVGSREFSDFLGARHLKFLWHNLFLEKKYPTLIKTKIKKSLVVAATNTENKCSKFGCKYTANMRVQSNQKPYSGKGMEAAETPAGNSWS